MATYKLVVKTPFNGFQKGDEISGQDIVNAILDVNSPDHVYINHVIKVQFNSTAKTPDIHISTVAESENSFDMSSTSI